MSCSPELASRIVGLLLADVGIGRLAGVPTPTRPPARSAPAAAHQVRRGYPRKVTPEIGDFIRASRGIPVPELLRQVEQRFGVQLAQGTIYKEWQSTHLHRPGGTTPTPRPSSTSRK